MSKSISLIIFIACLTMLVLGLPNPESDGVRPGYCHNHGRYIKEGEAVSEHERGICGQIVCRNAEQNELGHVVCGLIAKKPGCELKPEDTKTPYPECCGRNINCKDDAN